jgi:hypothetical protein
MNSIFKYDLDMVNSNLIKKNYDFFSRLFTQHLCSAERSLGNIALRKREGVGIQ